MRFAPIIACAVLLSGCNFKAVPDPTLSARDTAFMALVPDAEFDPHFARYQVTDPTKERPGTIVIETMERQLYLVLPDGKAMRYGVTVGDEAYGWKGALGDYLHGAAEEGTYDDQGLYIYYVMHDFSPYIGWVPMVVAAGGLAWMAFGEGLVSKPLGGVSAGFVVLVFVAVAVTGVPGLPFVGALGLVAASVWLAVGKSRIVVGDRASS